MTLMKKAVCCPGVTHRYTDLSCGWSNAWGSWSPFRAGKAWTRKRSLTSKQYLEGGSCMWDNSPFGGYEIRLWFHNTVSLQVLSLKSLDSAFCLCILIALFFFPHPLSSLSADSWYRSLWTPLYLLFIMNGWRQCWLSYVKVFSVPSFVAFDLFCYFWATVLHKSKFFIWFFLAFIHTVCKYRYNVVMLTSCQISRRFLILFPTISCHLIYLGVYSTSSQGRSKASLLEKSLWSLQIDLNTFSVNRQTLLHISIKSVLVWHLNVIL